MALYTCIKYFPLVLVSLVSNIAPLLIALFSWLYFQVSLSKMDLWILIISFGGVVLLISSSGGLGNFKMPSGQLGNSSGGVGGDENEDDDDLDTVQIFYVLVPSVCLLVTPFLTASIRLFTR